MTASGNGRRTRS